MTIYQRAREFAEDIMKTEEAISFFNIRDSIGETDPEQYSKAQRDYNNLINEIFSVIKYTIGEEDIINDTHNTSNTCNCGVCKRK